MSKYYKAFIRVVKSINSGDFYNSFGSENIVKEPLIVAKDKEEVRRMLQEKYPQFFPDGKVYTRETKDIAQFFYVVIYELFEWERQQIDCPTKWECAHCKQSHENTYLSKPRKFEKLFGDLMFCKSEEDYCLEAFKKEKYKDVEMPDDEYFIKKDSPNYIYKITEKETGKCYVGKTRNAPFFRWWNHLTHSHSPFGIYLRSTKLCSWTFEVLETLPAEVQDSEVFRIESNYIRAFDSIDNGFNSLISNKSVSHEQI
jgi:hypothetical protein